MDLISNWKIAIYSILDALCQYAGVFRFSLSAVNPSFSLYYCISILCMYAFLGLLFISKQAAFIGEGRARLNNFDLTAGRTRGRSRTEDAHILRCIAEEPEGQERF